MLVLGGNGLGQVLEVLAHHPLDVSIFCLKSHAPLVSEGSKPTHPCKKATLKLDFCMIKIKLVLHSKDAIIKKVHSLSKSVIALSLSCILTLQYM